jgi:hypothetical protein
MSIKSPIICVLFVVFLFPVECFSIEVIAEGRASGDYRTAREQALADAMREAVRIGIGVDLLGESKVKDFNLDYDRVLCSAFGHVKNYSIIESKLGNDGIYRVKIQAEVEKGAPENKDSLALKQLIQAKGAPRLAFQIKSLSEEEAEDSFSVSVLEEIAAELQIPVIRSHLDNNAASGVDYLVEGELDAILERTETIGTKPTTRIFTIACSLKAIDPNTRSIIATGVFGTDKLHKSTLPSENAAKRDAIKRLLTGSSPEGGMRFFERLLSRWVSETDLGTVKRLRFVGISPEDYEKIHLSLADNDKVGAVWPREFNASGTSIIDVETRLDNVGIGQDISRSASNSLVIDKMNANQITFRNNSTKVN